MARRAAALLAVAAVLAAAVGRVEAATLRAGECASFPATFTTTNFEYAASVGVIGTLPDGCKLTITKLYMGGTCSTQRNNEGSGCSGSGTVLPTTESGATAATCQAVFADAPSSALVTPRVPTSSTYQFDAAWLCTKYNTGFFFAQYTCADNSSTLDLSLPVRWASYTGGCGSTSSLPSWTRITIGVICGLIAVALLFTAFRMCTRRRPAPPAVQLGPMPPPQTGPQGYYTGSAAYPPQPGQGYAGQGYAGAGAWGSQPYPPAPAGYPTSYGSGGYGGGYGGAPTTPHVPPPMQTVVLGSPGAEAPPAPAAAPAGAGTGAAAAPASGGAPASGNPFSDSGAKV